MLYTIKSKFSIQENRISLRKVIRASGRNINKDGQCMVYCEVVSFYPNKKMTKLIPTGVKIAPSCWNSKKNDGSITNKDKEYIDKNYKIDYMYRRYMDQLALRERNTWEDRFEPDDLPSISYMFSKQSKGLVNFIDDYITYRKNKNTMRGTLKEFTTCKNRIIGFDDDRGQKTYFGDINLMWADNFEYYLTKKEYMSGTIEKTFTILITILNHFYERRDEMNINITDKFRSKSFKRGSKSINEANPLTKEQLLTLYNHTFKEKHLENTKIRFCLQSFIGCRYGDLFKIKPENIKDGWLLIKPSKTKKYDIEVNQPLNQYALEILEKYKFDTSSLYITNQVYNREIKKLWPIMIKEYPELNFKSDYTSHSARDSFITIAVLAGTNWKSILKWVGQSSYKIMNRYIKILPKYQESEMKNIF